MRKKSNLLTSTIAFLLGLTGALFIAPVASYAGNRFYLSQFEKLDLKQLSEREEAERLIENIRKLSQQGKYAEAIPLAEKLLAIIKKNAGSEHPAVATSLSLLGVLYQARGRYSEAEPLYQQALAIYKKTVGMEDTAVAQSLTALAGLYQAQGRYSEAEPLYQQALALYKKSFGTEDPAIATTLNSLAGLYQLQGRYSQAESLYQQALAMRQKLLGTEHPAVATTLNSLAGLYQLQGRYSQAESLYQQALAMLQKLLGTEHPEVGKILNDLAELYKTQGRYSEAEPLYQQALTIIKKSLGAEHPYFAKSLSNLAGLYQLQGRYSQAESLYQRALTIDKNSIGIKHPSFANTLSNLGGLYQLQGRYSQAEPLYQQALIIYKNSLGAKHPNVAKILTSLAILNQNQGRYSQAESLYQRALTIYKNSIGIKHPSFANTLSNLGGLYQLQSRYSQAEPIYQQALTIYKNSLGAKHPNVATIVNGLAISYAIQGKNDRALELYTQVLEIEESNLKSNLIAGSEAQKQQYMNLFFNTTNNIISLHLQNVADNPEAAKLAFTAILQRKGRILDFVTNTQEIVRKELDPQTRELFNKLIQVRTALANLVYEPPEKINPQNYAQQLNLLQKEAEQLEDQISRRSAAWQERFQPVTINSVRKFIPADAVLVEFIKYYPSNFQTGKRKLLEPRYAAYILTSNGQVKGIDLGEAAKIEQSLSEFRKNLQNRDTWEVTDSLIAGGKELESLIWQPLQSAIANKKHILISPDSALNLIPFEALIDRNGRYLVESKRFTYLSSGRELLRLDRNNSAANPPVVFGDPDFDGKGQIAALQRNTTRSFNFSESIAFSRLPATEKEAAKIKQIFPQFQIFTGDRATEQLIKQLDRPKILHLATHGFFVPADSNNSNLTRNTSNSIGVTNNNIAENNPIELSWLQSSLLRSGIVFAGTNIRSSAGEDGILTALEATNLNLRGTQLVVLSACDTGLGEVSIGEGVYGLRRALAIAGSESQTMSLWKVDDNVTQKLMVDYYQKLKNKLGRGEALRQVQLEMIKDPQYSPPYYWSSFIFSGDWTPLN